MRIPAAALALLAAAGTAAAGVDARTEALAARVAEAFLAVRPLAALPPLDEATGRAVGARVAGLLAARLGPVAGYKAALTSPAARARFGARGPVPGTLLRGMLRAGPAATVPMGAGVRLLAEADLIVRVGDGAINAARTDAELAAALDAVVPFVEVPDVPFAPGLAPTAAHLAAANAGARLGVTGPVMALRGAPPERLARLGAVRVQVRDAATGRPLGRGDARALLGHPIRAVRWLRDAVRAAGGRLRPGDLLSLGSLVAPVPAWPGLVYEARYAGLGPAGPVVVRVRFTR